MTLNQVTSGQVPFSDATKVERLDSHTYRINLDRTFCTGEVPNGGYAGSCMTAVASEHLSARGHRDVLTAHFEYPSRTSAGNAIVVVDDVKLGRQMSTLQLTLWQDGLLLQAPWITPSVSRRAILASANLVDLRSLKGMSLPTGYEETSAGDLPSPLPDFEALKTYDADKTWAKPKLPKFIAQTQLVLQNWDFYLPRGGPLAPGVLNMWIRLANGDRIKQPTLPYVADSLPFGMHTFLVSTEIRKRYLEAAAQTQKPQNNDIGQREHMWFPTVSLTLQAKMALPEDGVEWLAVRATSKQIKDGTFDIEVLVRDVDGHMVAMGHHVARIAEMTKNMRSKQSSAEARL